MLILEGRGDTVAVGHKVSYFNGICIKSLWIRKITFKIAKKKKNNVGKHGPL